MADRTSSSLFWAPSWFVRTEVRLHDHSLSLAVRKGRSYTNETRLGVDARSLAVNGKPSGAISSSGPRISMAAWQVWRGW